MVLLLFVGILALVSSIYSGYSYYSSITRAGKEYQKKINSKKCQEIARQHRDMLGISDTFGSENFHEVFPVTDEQIGLY